ncbi:uncharacterized protein LOC125863779 [Solanum stenotomum]|uniref:uncharacterized protein LOC125863779 n=1 Tax=Solanum stenotomum TaxID=172797 RepID=UPI0020D1A8FF|nr:uncharacterized protein LOC125863779 [Solanum stenotomum]
MVVKECRIAMLINDMDISHLMVHAQQIKEDKLKEGSREAKRANISDVTSHTRSPVDMVFLSSDKASTDGCFSCGNSGHKMRDCPMLAAKEREGKQPPSSASGSSDAKQNQFYALQTRGEQEGSPNVIIGMLKVFQLDVYSLLDPDTTLSFVTPYVAIRNLTFSSPMTMFVTIEAISSELLLRRIALGLDSFFLFLNFVGFSSTTFA